MQYEMDKTRLSESLDSVEIAEIQQKMLSRNEMDLSVLYNCQCILNSSNKIAACSSPKDIITRSIFS